MPDPRPRRRGPRSATATALVLALLAGCGEGEPTLGRRAIDVAKVPAPLLGAAKKELPGVEFTEAWSNHLPGREGVHSYEIRGKVASSGKTREVRIAPDGKILEKE